MKLILRVAAATMLCIPFHVSAECSAAEQAALEKLDRDWGDASAAGDAVAMGKFLAEDFRNLSPDGGEDKAATIAAAVKAAARASADAPKAMPDHYIIQCSADSATITHRVVFPYKDAAGKPQSWYRRSMHTLEKRNGHWVVVSTLGAPMHPADVLRYLERDWAAADVSGDAGWIENNYADDFVGVSSRTGKFTSKAEDIADAKASKSDTTAARVSDLNVRMSGDVAVVTGEYHAAGKDEKGANFARHVAFTDVWKKQDGRWLVWSSQGTSITD